MLLIRKWSVGRRKVCYHFVGNSKTAVADVCGVSMTTRRELVQKVGKTIEKHHMN